MDIETDIGVASDPSMETNTDTPVLIDSVHAMNENLLTGYKTALKKYYEEITPCEGLSNPFLIRVPDDYIQTKVRVMVVGQQTNGWDDIEVSNDVDNAAKMLMDAYHDFDLDGRWSNSAFWMASHKIFDRLNPKGPPKSFLWSNLVKVDVGCKRPRKSIEVPSAIWSYFRWRSALQNPM